jgi:mannosyltransferase OCH1-like enzyme
MLLLPLQTKYLCTLCIGIFFSLLLLLHYSRTPLTTYPFSHPSTPSLLPQAFPRKIWQSWKDDSEDPTDRTVGFPHQWRVINPQHQYERITDDNMDTYVQSQFSHSPEIVDTFLNLTDPIMRADLLRYMVMLADGGVWADIDVLPHKPISEWISPDSLPSVNLVLGIENDHNKQPIWPGSTYSVQLAQYTILAKPNHPALITLVDKVSENLRLLMETKTGKGPASNTFEEVMSNTGPFVFTDVMMKYFQEGTGEEYTGDELHDLQEPILIGDVLVLPKDCFGWLPHENTHGKDYVLVEHLFIGSWRGSHPG